MQVFFTNNSFIVVYEKKILFVKKCHENQRIEKTRSDKGSSRKPWTSTKAYAKSKKVAARKAARKLKISEYFLPRLKDFFKPLAKIHRS